MKTPLYEEHLKLKARMVDFAGWEMPIQYVGLKEEHAATRTAVGLFDVSHMGEIRVTGPHALATLEWLTTNDVSRLENGQAQYSLLPNENGGLVDDIIIYCVEKNANYLVCVNASNKDKDYQWMLKHNKGADIVDESSRWAQIAVQGPKACALIDQVLSAQTSQMKPFTFVHGEFANAKTMIATTGYTGEAGAEIFVEAKGAAALWQALLEKGGPLGAQAVGLGARDTLRTEMKYSLYGHEIDDLSNPYAAGLGWVIKPAKKDFIGKNIILSTKEKGLAKKLIGFKMLDKGIPRQGYTLWNEQNESVGYVTSGTHSPTLDEPIGIGYLDVTLSEEGSTFFVDIRGRKVKAQVAKTPFVNKI